MKKTIALLIAVFTLNANAVLPGPDVYMTQITSVTPEAADFARGHIKVNLTDQVVELTLEGRIPCSPDGLICATVMPVIRTISLPILSVQENEGSLKVIAEQDMRPVDGLYQRLEIHSGHPNDFVPFYARYTSMVPRIEIVEELTLLGDSPLTQVVY